MGGTDAATTRHDCLGCVGSIINFQHLLKATASRSCIRFGDVKLVTVEELKRFQNLFGSQHRLPTLEGATECTDGTIAVGLQVSHVNWFLKIRPVTTSLN